MYRKQRIFAILNISNFKGGEMVRVFITNHFSVLLSVLFFNLHQIYTKYTVLHSNILFHFFRNIIWFLVSINI